MVLFYMIFPSYVFHSFRKIGQGDTEKEGKIISSLQELQVGGSRQCLGPQVWNPGSGGEMWDVLRACITQQADEAQRGQKQLPRKQRYQPVPGTAQKSVWLSATKLYNLLPSHCQSGVLLAFILDFLT